MSTAPCEEGLPLVVGVLFAAEFPSCAGVVIVDVTAGSSQTALIPETVRGRVVGAFRTLDHGFRPIGALVGGVPGTAIGVRPTLWVATVGAVLAVLWPLPSPLPRMREPPAREPEPATTAF